MTGPLTILLIGSLLQGSNCNSFQVNLPRIVKVMTGSCVTVPCSFDVANPRTLNNQCKAIWATQSKKDAPQLTDRNPLTGDLTKKNCTTTFSSMQTGDTKDYYFRLGCAYPNGYSFIPPNFPSVEIEVTDNFPSPTLTPSSLKIKEGESVSLTCSAPAPCLPHPPTLIWTPKLGDIQETLQENQDKTKFKTSVMNFTASQLYNKQNISCTAVYKKQDGSSDAALTSSLIPDVLYSPKNVTISVSPSGSVVENSNVTLTCNSDANPAEQNYTWYRDDGGQETVIGAGKILNIKVTTDRKMFFCKAVNEIGNKPSNITHIDVLYSPKNVTVSVSPSGSVVENSNVTLTCSSDANPAEQNYTWYRADGGQETVIGTGNILNIKVTTDRDIFFCTAQNDLGEECSNLSHIDVVFPPQILLSSNCTKTANHLKCSCETVGNPTPMTHWFFNEQPVSPSSQVMVTNECLDGSHLRSIITVNEPQNRDLSTLLCFSSNSLGSAIKQFFASCLENSRENQGLIQAFVLITRVTGFVSLVFAVLYLVRFHKIHHQARGIGGDVSTDAYQMKEKNEVPNSIKDVLYANSAALSQAENHQPETDIKCTNSSYEM